MEFQTLNNGKKIPSLGLGTWFIDNDKVDKAILDAVKIGYRHIDTAQAYANESGVGLGVKACGLSREEIFVTSKVAAEAKTYDSAANAIDETLEKTGLDYIDLMLVHSPQPWAEWRENKRYFDENIEVWKAFEDAYKSGKVKAIGVSNFLIDDLENLIANCEIKPMVNQLLIHIGNTPTALIDYCKKQDIIVEAYSPIAHGEALKNETISAMAQKYGISVAQLCIKYVLNLGIIALPKASSKAHMQNNAKLDFEISHGDMEILKSLDFKDYGEHSHFPVFSGKDI